MVSEKPVIRKRPELTTLPEVPTILKLSEVETGTHLMRLNLPFTLTHLAQAGVKKAWVLIRTGKSVMTMLGSDSAYFNQFRQELQELLYKKYPSFRKHLGIATMCKISYGSHYTNNPENKSDVVTSLHYIADVPAFQQKFDECGFSQVPLLVFQIMIEKPTMILTFTRHIHYKGFIVSQFDRRAYDTYSERQLLDLIRDNPVLQNMRCHTCQTSLIYGVSETCIVKPKEGNKNE